MEELLELRSAVEAGRTADALLIIQEMEDMAKKATINKIGSFAKVLLLHLIKYHAEGRMTRSWRRSIRNAVEEIRETNERLNGGLYLQPEELVTILERRFPTALIDAADEAFEGRYSARELLQKIDAERIKAEALDYILNGTPESED